jgi:hypothetical protein
MKAHTGEQQLANYTIKHADPHEKLSQKYHHRREQEKQKQ